MKIFVFILVFVLLLAAYAAAFGTTFCEGWEDGFKAGYCYRKSSGCVSPIAPMCPHPRIDEDNYQSGYNRGFLAGMNAQK